MPNEIDFVNFDPMGNYVGPFTPPPKVSQPSNKPPTPTTTTTVTDVTVGEDGLPETDTGTTGVVVFDGASALQNPITPSPNILDQYASYSYIISWYMITAEQFNELSKSVNKSLNISSWSLLMQSGGASAQQQSSQESNSGVSLNEDSMNFGIPVGRLSGGFPRASISAQAGRNKYFSNDYYIDDVVIKYTFANGSPTNASDLDFKVIEPNGITLIERLVKAAVDNNKDPKANLITTKYVLVIRFYGWDEKGNLITKIKQAPGTPAQTPNDYNATVVKYIPFQLKDLTFKVAGKGIEYTISAGPVAMETGFGQALGTIPEQFQLTGMTVDDILNGRVLEKTVTTTGGGREDKNSPPPEKNQQRSVALNSMNSDGTYAGSTGPSSTPMFDG